MPLRTVLDRVVTRLEGLTVLDRPAAGLSAVLAKAFGDGAVRSALSGTDTGHPAHPAVVVVPLGALLSATVLDATGSDRGAARRLNGLGLLGALPAVSSGLSDWGYTTGAEARVGLVHATVIDTALAAYALSWRARRRGDDAAAHRWGYAGAGVLAAGGWLGGHLTYALGVGVDTNAFLTGPVEWSDAALDADVHEGQLTGADVDGVALVLSRVGGRVVAIGGRCSHRGGPLAEGSVEEGCVVCPWHGGRFDLRDGQVAGAPANVAQPVYEVRVAGPQVQVRRQELRSLRSNPA